VTFDTRLGWTCHDVEIAVVGQNLAEQQHREFGIADIPRAVYGTVTWRF
jgi:hypothetical protein